MLLHGARVMESVKPILDSETRTEDVKEQVNNKNTALFSLLNFTFLHTGVCLTQISFGRVKGFGENMEGEGEEVKETESDKWD